MKKIKFLSIFLMLVFFSSNLLAETKPNCDEIKADTGVKMYEKWKCKQGKTGGEGIGQKLKKIFKKKNQHLSQIENKLKELNISIPDAPSPVGAYVAFKKINNLLFISGQLPIGLDGKMVKGKVGKNLNLQNGQEAAKLCAINILAQVKKATDGDLSKVKNCIKITGFVNSTDDFFDQPKVINPASEILSTLFGDKGKHTRAAVSTNSLPLGAAVEIDAIFEML